MNCPFIIGDRIHRLSGITIYQDGKVLEDLNGVLRLDPLEPDATVTELTEKGFKYRYDSRVPIGPVRWGSWTKEGECFELGFPYWRKVS